MTDPHLEFAVLGMRRIAGRHARETRLLRTFCLCVGIVLAAVALSSRWRA